MFGPVADTSTLKSVVLLIRTVSDVFAKSDWSIVIWAESAKGKASNSNSVGFIGGVLIKNSDSQPLWHLNPEYCNEINWNQFFCNHFHNDCLNLNSGFVNFITICIFIVIFQTE